MKRLITATTLATTLLFGGMVFADQSYPDMTGKWNTKSYSHHHENKGFLNVSDANGKWVVTEQQGRFFHGERTYTNRSDKKTYTEGFSGVISKDGKRIYLVDHDEDLLFGDILDDGSIELIIMDDGGNDDISRIGVLEIEKAK
ncbi:MAG: hypothetical protein WC965_09870 [Thiohalomonadaceae bacterium]